MGNESSAKPETVLPTVALVVCNSTPVVCNFDRLAFCADLQRDVVGGNNTDLDGLAGYGGFCKSSLGDGEIVFARGTLTKT